MRNQVMVSGFKIDIQPVGDGIYYASCEKLPDLEYYFRDLPQLRRELPSTIEEVVGNMKKEREREIEIGRERAASGYGSHAALDQRLQVRPGARLELSPETQKLREEIKVAMREALKEANKGLDPMTGIPYHWRSPK